MKDFDSALFFYGSNTRTTISPKASVQIEGICYANENKYFMSSELFFTLPSVLHQVLFPDSTSFIDTMTSTASLETENIFYPNPLQKTITVSKKYDYLEFFNSQGILVLKTKERTIDVENWSRGTYFVRCFYQNKLKQIVKLEKP